MPQKQSNQNNNSNSNNIKVSFALQSNSFIIPINGVDKFLDHHPEHIEDDWRMGDDYSFAQD